MVDARRQPSRKPRTLELLIVLALALVYLALWPLSSRPAAAPAPRSARSERVAAPRTGEMVWLQTLPSSERAPITLPDGWTLATQGPSVVAESPRDAPRARAAPRARRTVVATRRARIRTRSS